MNKISQFFSRLVSRFRPKEEQETLDAETVPVKRAAASAIPQGRALIYIMILCLIPTLISIFYVWNKIEALESVENHIHSVSEQAFVKEKRQATNQSLRTYFKDADRFYIDKHLETLSFLEPETEALTRLTQQKNFPEDEMVRRRLDFLTTSQNALTFTEGVVQNYGVFQETTETLSHTVEINVKDLQKLLTRIEGVSLVGEAVPEGRPQLIILDLKLEKKKSMDTNEIFLLNMKLLKRDFL